MSEVGSYYFALAFTEGALMPAASSCPKCGQHSFELTYLTSGNPRTNISAVQCENCGAIVGVLDDLGKTLANMEKRLKVIEQKLKT
jgi:predicted nucleic-acid-binding Zn-ribbon protein